MQGNSHIRLGRQLADQFEITGIARAAFLYGNIQPDLAVPSHLGEDTGRRLDGHNFKTASVRVMALFYRLRYGCVGAQDYFLLGKLCHYAADCFTWAHNEDYPGTLSAHVSYEHRLDKMLRDKAALSVMTPDELDELSLPEFFFRAHQLYSRRQPGLERDLLFIRMVTSQIVAVLGEGAFLQECKAARQTVSQIDGSFSARLI